MTEPEKFFHKIVNDIPDAIEGKMFGAMCVKSTSGKAVAIFWKNNMLFKLGKKEQEEALALDGASVGSHLYAPDKPMKGWVQIPTKHADKWADLTAKAMAYVMTLGK